MAEMIIKAIKQKAPTVIKTINHHFLFQAVTVIDLPFETFSATTLDWDWRDRQPSHEALRWSFCP